MCFYILKLKPFTVCATFSFPCVSTDVGVSYKALWSTIGLLWGWFGSDSRPVDIPQEQFVPAASEHGPADLAIDKSETGRSWFPSACRCITVYSSLHSTLRTKQVKSDWRSGLRSDTLSDWLTVQLSSPDIEDFDPDSAVASGQRQSEEARFHGKRSQEEERPNLKMRRRRLRRKMMMTLKKTKVTL